MKNIAKGLLVLAAGLFGLSVSSNAQSVVLNGAGSSAMWLELGKAAQVNPTNAVCLFTSGNNAAFHVQVTDGTSGTTLIDNGAAWIAWTTGGGSCANPGTSAQIYEYVNTDSVVGDRCLFNASAATNPCRIINNFPTSGPTMAGTAHGIYTTTGDTPGNETAIMPFSIAMALQGNGVPTFAGTDIRPEDARFAIYRATLDTPASGTRVCDATITQFSGGTGTATQYRSLGYKNGDTISGFGGSGSFNVINFTLPTGGFTVTPLGATPIVVFTQTDGNNLNGFGNPAITNINRSTLALLLDGTIGFTRDAITPGLGVTVPSGDATLANVWVREPLSGTYNTMEYNIPNNVELQTSQDVGVEQLSPLTPNALGNFNMNCNSTFNLPASNGTLMGTLEGNLKKRAIGTGAEVSDVLGTVDSIGYAFWSAGNFQNANGNSKYLTVDGVDPLGTGSAGVIGGIPTPTNGGLPFVTLQNVANGSYPIWSLLRLVTLGTGSSTTTSAAQGLAESAQGFVTTSTPDFVPFDNAPAGGPIGNMLVERAHFTPPGIYTSGSEPVPQNAVNVVAHVPLFTEVGGDVGGVAIPYQADLDYCFAYTGSLSSCTVGHSFTSTQVPSSIRRQ